MESDSHGASNIVPPSPGKHYQFTVLQKLRKWNSAEPEAEDSLTLQT